MVDVFYKQIQNKDFSLCSSHYNIFSAILALVLNSDSTE